MKNLFIISESEKKRILGMHKHATQKQYLKEAVSAPEPILKSSSETSAIFYQAELPKGKSGPLDKTKKEDFLTKAANILRYSQAAIAKFYNDPTYKLPKFIKIKVGTDALGSESQNVVVQDERMKAARQLVLDAFKKSGLGYNATQIESWIATSYNYDPTKLDRNLHDEDQVGDRPEERFIKVSISSVVTMGHDESGIDEIEDIIRIARGWNINPDEEGIAEGICKLETYSDITDLDNELRNVGGLEYFINSSITNGLTTWGSDSKERREIKACLNKASNNSGKGDIADIVGDKLSIIGM